MENKMLRIIGFFTVMSLLGCGNARNLSASSGLKSEPIVQIKTLSGQMKLGKVNLTLYTGTPDLKRIQGRVGSRDEMIKTAAIVTQNGKNRQEYRDGIQESHAPVYWVTATPETIELAAFVDASFAEHLKKPIIRMSKTASYQKAPVFKKWFFNPFYQGSNDNDRSHGMNLAMCRVNIDGLAECGFYVAGGLEPSHYSTEDYEWLKRETDRFRHIGDEEIEVSSANILENSEKLVGVQLNFDPKATVSVTTQSSRLDGSPVQATVAPIEDLLIQFELEP